MRRVFAALTVACAIAFPLATASPAAAQPAPPRFIPPVEAPVRDPFRPPPHPYGPGNRGIEYATEPGTAVRAAGAGVIAFAGEIAHERYVSIDHGAGLRTTYSYLASIATVAGAIVAQGDAIGTSTERLHFGVRRRGVYIDPAWLFALDRPARARLVAIDEPWT